MIDAVKKMSNDPTISGILVQLPMPKHINEEQVLNNIPPEKDVDAANPFNLGCLAMKNRTPFFIACTPLATQQMIFHAL